jgi:uridine monophosphate synthetase
MTKKELVKSLHKIGALKFGEFTLKSGKKSPYYVDMRILASYPRVLKQAGQTLGEMILNDPDRPNVLCGIPAAGLAIATAIGLETGIPVFYTKKEPIVYKDLVNYLSRILETRDGESFRPEERAGITKALEIINAMRGLKAHGLPQYVDGEYREGAQIAIVDDLITTAESKLEARDLILLDAVRRNLHVTIVGVYVILDREQGGAETLENAGIKLRSVATIREAARLLHEDGELQSDMYNTIINYTLQDRRASGLE